MILDAFDRDALSHPCGALTRSRPFIGRSSYMRRLLDEIPTELPSSMKPSLSSRVVPQAGCERHEENEDRMKDY